MPVFLSELAGNPNNCTGIEARSVSYELSKVLVVGLIELVFDDYALVSAQIAGQDVYGKITYSLFTPNGLKVESENLPDQVHVLNKPRSEIHGLMLPNISQFDTAQCAKLNRIHGNSPILTCGGLPHP